MRLIIDCPTEPDDYKIALTAAQRQTQPYFRLGKILQYWSEQWREYINKTWMNEVMILVFGHPPSGKLDEDQLFWPNFKVSRSIA